MFYTFETIIFNESPHTRTPIYRCPHFDFRLTIPYSSPKQKSDSGKLRELIDCMTALFRILINFFKISEQCELQNSIR